CRSTAWAWSRGRSRLRRSSRSTIRAPAGPRIRSCRRTRCGRLLTLASAYFSALASASPRHAPSVSTTFVTPLEAAWLCVKLVRSGALPGAARRRRLASVLYEPAQFEPLTAEPWDPGRVEDAIATIVADADAAFDPGVLWPAHEWDGWEEPLPLKNLYVGAAGVVWALDALRRRGHAETSLDLAAAALRTLELKRAEPDSTAD